MRIVSNCRVCKTTSVLPRFLSLFVCIVIGAASASSLMAKDQIAISQHQELRKAALSSLANQDCDKAIECYTQILASNPDDALSIKADLGLCYKIKRDYARAMPLFAEVGAISNPRQAEVLYWTDDCFCEQGKMSEAADLLTNMYKTMPDLRTSILIRRLNRFEALGRVKEAIVDLKELVPLIPRNEARLFRIKLAALTLKNDGLTPEFTSAFNEACNETITVVASESINTVAADSLRLELNNIRLAIEERMWTDGKKAEAIEYLIKLLIEQPEMKADVLIRLSIRHEMLNKPKDVASDMVEFVKSFPGDERAKLFAIKAAEYAFKGSGDCAESQEVLRSALDTIASPGVSREQVKTLKNEMGTALIRASQLDKAEQLFKALLQEYPDDPQIKINLGLCYRGKTDYDKAIPLLQEVVNTAQGDFLLESICRYQDCLTDQSKYAEAINYLAARNSEFPQFGATLLGRKAKCLAEKFDKFTDAIRDYEELMQRFPSRPEAKSAELNIANLMVFGLRDFALAKAKLNAYITQHPVDLETIVAFHDLGYCNYLKGDYSDAAKAFMEGIQYPDPGNYRPLMLSLAIDCYKKLGQPNRAAATAQTLLKGFPDDPWSEVTLGAFPEFAALKQ
ncbi:MAG: tetratricopeptide repeat protein [Armatimonadetes bacterium]|nr:tetratricopeptide repeat protein [Armatimonadota bacterium]